MKLVERYIAKIVLSSTILVTLLLSVCQLFMLFIEQMSDMGKEGFGITQALLFGLLQMPYQVYLFYPMACLLGCMIGLGRLASYGELLVMQSAGMSVERVSMAVLKAALILIVVTTTIGETVVPKLVYIANDRKVQTVSGGQSLRTSNGTWMRYKNDFIEVDTIIAKKHLKQVYQFHFDDAHKLRWARKIAQIDYLNGVWQARDIAETILYDDHTYAQHINTMAWDISLKPMLLSVDSNYPEEMSIAELRQYLQTQKVNHQSAYQYQLAYFQRIIQPLTTIVMMLLAIPFIFGPLRNSTVGAKIIAGVALGFCFQLFNRFLGPVSQLLQWPPEIAALGPTCAFIFVGIYLMHNSR